MSVKIDKYGKAYDPSEKARKALASLRDFFEGREGPCDYAPGRNEAFAALADRLQTCDALEAKIQRQLSEQEERLRNEFEAETRSRESS